ncbi:MAG: hypothetical protein HDS32_04630 [Bacteroides sp.]|nr:hypothetical protein [Bacteroides sp.]
MKYLKSLALLLFSLTILTSCSEYEDFPADVYSMNETESYGKNTKATENNTNDSDDDDNTEPNDTTGSGKITILIDEPEVEDIDFTITLP